MKRTFHLTTHCTIKAPAARLWDETINISAYPHWWPSIKKVVLHGNDRQLQQDSRLTVHIRGFLPHTLVFSALIISCVDCDHIELSVSGGLEGSGRFSLAESGAETEVRFQWNVDLASPLLHFLSKLPPVHALFAANHHYVMRKAMQRMKLRMEDERS